MSGTIIKLKYSDVTAQPASDDLVHAEPAYSFNSDVLFIGKTDGVTVDPIIIGGKKFTDMMDHTAGVLTASSTIIVDSNKHIDELISGGLTLTTSGGSGQKVTSIETTIGVSPTDTQLITAQGVKEYVDGVIVNVSLNELDDVTYLTTPANGEVIVYNATSGEWENRAISGDATLATNGALTLANSGVTASTYGSTTTIPVLTIDAKGRVTSATTASISTTLNITDGTNNDGVALGTDTLTFTGGTGLTSTVSDDEVTYDLDDTAVTAGSYGSSTQIPTFTVDQQGRITAAGTASISTTLSIAADSGSGDGVALATDTLTISGGEGIDTSVTGDTITISGEDASTTNKGIASFNSADFTVASGVVSIASLSNAQLDNSSLTVGSTTISLGGTSTSIDGLTQIDVDNIRIDGNVISSTDTDGDIVLNPNGAGNIDANSNRITSVADPINGTDAANKQYVDEVAQGVSVKPAVLAATTANLSGTYDNGTSGVGATLNLGPSASLTIDGVSLTSQYDGVLVKDQTNAYENGRYFVSQVGDAGTDWILLRCVYCDENDEIPSSYVFVQSGDTYEATGWVALVEDPAAFNVGVDDILWQQFSGAGTYSAGDGLNLSGTIFSVNTDNGLEVVADNVQLASTVAGAGLTYTSGVLDIVGTNDRIVVNADSIDIDANYVGQNTITTVGTITTGTWNGDTIDEAYGGTGITSYTQGDILYANSSGALVKLAAGSEGEVLQVNASGEPEWGIIDGGTF